MKHLKTFESVSDTDRERILKHIEDLYVQEFSSEEDFNEFVLDACNESDLDDVDWEHISYDVIHRLGLDARELGVTSDELDGIVNDVMSKVDLDDYNEARDGKDGTREEWEMKKLVKRYNV